MDIHTIAICENGHIRKYLRKASVFDESGEITDLSEIGQSINPVLDAPDYCPDCGKRVLSVCPKCSQPIETSDRGRIHGDEEDRPDFCRGCGEDFPWTTTVESEVSREGAFLQISQDEVHGHFYPDLVHEINLVYQVQADHAVLILNRKLIESLITDILRAELGYENIQEFYDTETGQHHGLGRLIENLKKNAEHFRKHSNSLDEEFFQEVMELKHSGDSSAHTIEEEVDETDLKSKSETATRVAKVLFRVRKSVLTMNG